MVFIALIDEEGKLYVVVDPLYNKIYKARDINELEIELPYYTWAKVEITSGSESHIRDCRFVSTATIKMFEHGNWMVKVEV